MNTIEFKVQYQDINGSWCNIYGTHYTYADALDKMLYEVKADPEYDHRIVRVESQVLGHVTGEGNINE